MFTFEIVKNIPYIVINRIYLHKIRISHIQRTLLLQRHIIISNYRRHSCLEMGENGFNAYL
jgi:hypothetical protein